MARGEIVAWLNSDDVFLPGAVGHVVDAFLSEPDLGAVYGEGYQIDIDGNIKQRFSVTEPFNLWKLVYMSDYILQQTVFFRRDVFDDVGLLDESLHYGMDWEILMRIGKRHMLRYLPYYMGSIREYGEAKTSTGGARRFWELAKIMRRHGRSAFPPGCVIYGLDTYQRIICEFIASFFRGPLSGFGEKLQGFVARWCAKIAHYTIRESQGLYSDGWATRKLHYMLPPCQGRFLEIEISLPAGMFTRQVLDIEINGRRHARETLAPGDYRLPLRLPEAMWDETLELTIVAKAVYQPSRRRRQRRPPETLLPAQGHQLHDAPRDATRRVVFPRPTYSTDIEKMRKSKVRESPFAPAFPPPSTWKVKRFEPAAKGRLR